jgi:beta-RFAP synthase
MIHIRTASRLHFGLLSLSGAGSIRWPGSETKARRFGGVGLMIDPPDLEMTVRPASAWSAEGPLAERALAFARRCAEAMPAGALQPQHLHIGSAPPEHSGFGTGTQLGLAVARALAAATGEESPAVVDLARQTGRGARSALGIHGFAAGGFLVDAGKDESDSVAPLVASVNFPESWRIVVFLPPVGSGWHSQVEERAFRQLTGIPDDVARTDALCRLVLHGMLPALAQRDLTAFGEALYDFNRQVGEAFAPVQGGVYAHPLVAELIALLRDKGVRGVGQSSWGPATFAVVEDEEHAAETIRIVTQRFGWEKEHAYLARAVNHGAEVLVR